MIEKTWDISNGDGDALAEIAEIICREVKGFISENITTAEVIHHFNEELKKSDWTNMVFKVADCTVSYNVIRLKKQLSFSSGFNLPQKEHQIDIGPFSVGLRLEGSYLSLDTSRAADIIQMYLMLEKFNTDMQKNLVSEEDDEDMKASEMLRFFEDGGFTMTGNLAWAKPIHTSFGKMGFQVTMNEDLGPTIRSSYIDMLYVLLGMAEAE